LADNRTGAIFCLGDYRTGAILYSDDNRTGAILRLDDNRTGAILYTWCIWWVGIWYSSVWVIAPVRYYVLDVFDVYSVL
jgi:hypothetical protein